MGTTRMAARAGLAGALALALLAGPLTLAYGAEPEPTPSVPAVPGDAEEPPADATTPTDPPSTPTPSPSPSTPTEEPAGGTDIAPPATTEQPAPSPFAAPLMAATAGPTALMPAPAPLDAYAPYNPQSTCDPTAKPGTQYVLHLATTFGVNRGSSISRACTVGGTSEHKEGRAFDWSANIQNPYELEAANRFVGWLTEVGPDGKVGYNARRLGVMYVIWNGRIWSNSSSSAAWRAYTGTNPHTDHVHVSLSWHGAYMRSSWWTGIAVPSGASVISYVRQVYQDLFHRDVDPSGLQSWTTALNNGTPRIAVANAITSSTEYRSRLIGGVYNEFLGRDAEPSGRDSWLAAMAGGLTIQGLESGFLASPEYYLQSGSTDTGWVRRLYQHVLGREAADSEVQWWVAALAAGASRQTVAYGFVLSTERLVTVVNGYYLDLLGRGIDPSGQQSWVSAIQRGTRTELIIGELIASPEYAANVERSSH